MITICIPSYRRIEKLKKLLKYYSDLDIEFMILVGLSDEAHVFNKLVEYTDNLAIADQISIVHTPGKDVIETLNHLLSIVDSAYAILNCDDDYLIPETLLKMNYFLDKNPQYEGVNGKALLFNSHNSFFYKYKMRSLDKESASDRLQDFSKDYFGILFSLFRIDSFKQIMNVPEIHSIPIREEVYSSFFASLVGRIGHIRKVFLVRSFGHDRREMGSEIDEYSANVLKNFISDKIIELDNKNRAESNRVVDEALENYFEALPSTIDISFQRIFRIILKILRKVSGSHNFQFRHLYSFQKTHSQINMVSSILETKHE